MDAPTRAEPRPCLDFASCGLNVVFTIISNSVPRGEASGSREPQLQVEHQSMILENARLVGSEVKVVVIPCIYTYIYIYII